MSTQALRAFGTLADLDLDFASNDRPQLVTELLSHCGAHSEAAFWWAQPVSLRTAALLQITALTEQLSALPFSAECALCGERFEFDLSLAQLVAGQDFQPLLTVEVHGQPISLRRATGADLREWRAAPSVDAQRMLNSLLLEGDVAVEQLSELSAAIAQADPLAAFAVACQCPGCGADREVDIDLDAAALSRLQQRQRALLRDIHTLARHYGWSEAQVLAIPATRRAQYLALIEQHHE